MDQPKIERMLRLMKLMSGSDNYTIEELGKQLDLSYRSVYRYIETFKSCGFVVVKVKSNVYKIGKMPKGQINMKNLIYFSEEEAYLVNKLINGLHPSNQLKADLKKKLSAIYSYTNIADYVHSEDTALNIEELGKAIREKRKVILKSYESGNSQEVSDRFIEPFEFTTNHIDIWGYDLAKQENRVFKISRIGKVSILDDNWSNEEKHRKSFTDCFRMSGFDQTPITLELSLKAKNILLEEYPLAAEDLKKVQNKWLLKTMVCNITGVGRFVIGLADEINVIDSPHLTRYIHDFAKSFLC